MVQDSTFVNHTTHTYTERERGPALTGLPTEPHLSHSRGPNTLSLETAKKGLGS